MILGLENNELGRKMKVLKQTNHNIIEKDNDFNELRTARDCMRWASSQFYQYDLVFAHGVDNAFDEAIYLILGALALPPDTPESWWDCRLTQTEKNRILSLLIQRIEKRKPTAYLLKEGWFAGLRFFIDERVLVPRSPIAELIETQFSPWIEAKKVGYILDLCTGSGCIGIASAYAFPDAEVDLLDVSNSALDVAKINIEQHGLKKRVHPILSDLFSALKTQCYDIIVSNPPYVDASDMNVLSKEHQHEPALGLQAGEDGLDLVRVILKEAGQYLSPQGILIVEVGNSEKAVAQTWSKVPFFWLEFERGGQGVFLLTKQDLDVYFKETFVDN